MIGCSYKSCDVILSSLEVLCPLHRVIVLISPLTFARVNVSPLGSGALAGHPFNIDRELLAKVCMYFVSKWLLDEVTVAALSITYGTQYIP